MNQNILLVLLNTTAISKKNNFKHIMLGYTEASLVVMCYNITTSQMATITI